MSKPFKIIMTIIGLIVAWAFISSLGDKPATSPPISQQQRIDNSMQDIHDKVANDAVEEYEIAKRQGDKIQICVQAGMVSAAYLQAKNEPKYNE